MKPAVTPRSDGPSSRGLFPLYMCDRNKATPNLEVPGTLLTYTVKHIYIQLHPVSVPALMRRQGDCAPPHKDVSHSK